jgi:hypothetical protein
MKSKIPHDPFNEIQPQVPAHVPPPEPRELASIDSDQSRADRKNPRPRILTDEGFDHAFTPEPEHTKKYDYSKHLERGKK